MRATVRSCSRSCRFGRCPSSPSRTSVRRLPGCLAAFPAGRRGLGANPLKIIDSRFPGIDWGIARLRCGRRRGRREVQPHRWGDREHRLRRQPDPLIAGDGLTVHHQQVVVRSVNGVASTTLHDSRVQILNGGIVDDQVAIRVSTNRQHVAVKCRHLSATGTGGDGDLGGGCC